MIDAAITHIAGELNQYLKRSFDLTEDLVVISNILEQDGSVATKSSFRWSILKKTPFLIDTKAR